MKMFMIAFGLLLFALTKGQFEPDGPSDQPGCPYNPHAESFYRAHEHRTTKPEHNWVCDESFETKLKICISMLKTFTARRLTSTYEIVKDKDNVTKECKEEGVTFFEPMRNESELYDPTEVTIGVWMFNCPITKMELTFPKIVQVPPLNIIKDFYITKGKVDDRPIVAVLQPSPYLDDNLCIQDVYIFDYDKIKT